MTITFADDVLRPAGLTERDCRIEFACWLFDCGRLELWPAAQVAELSRVEFESELLKRGLPICRFSEAEFAEDMRTAERLGL